MYAAALLFSSVVTAGTTGLPYFHVGSWGFIQGFGVIVAAGVLIGASLLRRYAEWHGVEDDHIRGITGWVTVAGFIGAHLFDVLAYQWDDLQKDPILLFKIWAGISSYGGFIGGAIGFALYVWWKRLPVRLFADITLVGLLPAFSIGRIGCSMVSDHIGAIADPNNWYSFLAENYPRDQSGENSGIAHLFQVWDQAHQSVPISERAQSVLAWNLGLIELLYLIPVNALILWLAFRSAKRLNAGFVTVLCGVLYAPVRFFLDYLRPENSDPRYFGLTFAQWASILAFGAALYAANKIFRNGKPYETVTKTSGEAQAKLKSILRDDTDKQKRDKEEADAEKARKDKERHRLKEEQEKEDARLEKEALAAGKADEAAAEDDAEEDEGEEEEAKDEAKEADKAPAPKPQPRPQQQKKPGGGNKKKKKKKR